MLDGQTGPDLGWIDYTFGRFVLRSRQRLLLADGEPAELGGRAFDLLLLLVKSAGALVTKDAILDQVWHGVAVEENNLQVQISALRRVLGPARTCILTVPGRGYRFIAPVSLARADAVPADDKRSGCERGPLSVMLLPLLNRSDSSLDWFADAVTDSLTTDLARTLPSASVVAQTVAASYRGQPVDVREMGRAEGVRFVLEGSVLLTDDEVRVNVQLIEAASGSHVWAERFDKARRGVMQVQDEIVGRLSRSVRLQMIAHEARRAEVTGSGRQYAATAPGFVVRGHAAASQAMLTSKNLQIAAACYRSALDIDPSSADALAGIASARIYQVLNGYMLEKPDVGLAEAEDNIRRALSLVPGHIAALRARAALLRARGLFADALVAARSVLAHNPADPTGHREVGLNLLYLGRDEQAVESFRRADAVLPLDPMRWTWLQGLGRTLIHLGYDQQAADVLRLAIDSNPAYPSAHGFLAAALALAGQDERAQAEAALYRAAEGEAGANGASIRSAVPVDATHAVYRRGNDRLLSGLRRANRA